MTKFFKIPLSGLPLAIAAGVAVSAFTAAPVVPGSTAAAKELRLAHWMSTRHSMHRFIMDPWTKDVAKMSGGKFTVKIYPGGALGKGPVAQYKRAVDGIADITFGLPGFTASLFKRTGAIELPGVATSGPDGSEKLWKAMSLLQPEWKKVKVLGLWVGEPQILMSKNKPLRTLADLKGLKIRTPSKVQAEIIKALGATPVPMPITRVYNALNTGVIDAVFTGASTIRSFKFGEVAKYYTTGLPDVRSPFFMVMNKNSWNKLSAAEKKLINETTGKALSMKAGKIYDGETEKSLDTVRNTGKHEVFKLSKEEFAKFNKIMLAFRAKKVAEMDKAGLQASKILAAMGVK